MREGRPRQRRRHDPDLKRRVLAECDAPGASVAQVALAHGLNANLVHKWRRLGGHRASAPTTSVSTSEFVPVALPASDELRADIHVELRRGPTAITVTWPIAAAAELGIWMRELLR
jgi:transposase